MKWETQYNGPINIVDMSNKHIENTIKMIERNSVFSRIKCAKELKFMKNVLEKRDYNDKFDQILNKLVNE